MKELIYITANEMKFRQAARTCEQFGVALQQGTLDIPEIQAETGEPVARDKAAKAFAQLQHPLLVSDDSWMIPGLGGFPGPYMKDVNHWFRVDDWVRLTAPLTDRRIMLHQVVVYQDAHKQKAFAVDIEGELLLKPRGEKPIFPHTTLVSFDGGQHSIAEHHEQGNIASLHHRNPWHDFAEWYNSQA
ncbi:MAG TPA: non-canonical purine NTP pyrophosphatase [Candidatus Saccharimonadales bacterium]|nr:non-canonical purine NTP pyrophosphatase [Candidatus Saccharimonadales bacterium]